MTPTKHKPSENAVRAAKAIADIRNLGVFHEHCGGWELNPADESELASLIDQHCHLAELNAVVEAVRKCANSDNDFVSVYEWVLIEKALSALDAKKGGG